MGNFSYQRPKESPIVEYLDVPAYCYFSNEITQPIGNSSPVFVLMTQVNEYPDGVIEYAPYGEDMFMPFEVEGIPENYYMPGFGYFYRGMGIVKVTSKTGQTTTHKTIIR